MNQSNPLLKTDKREQISRKEFRKRLMPPVGTILANMFRVEYINYGSLWMSVSYASTPPRGGDVMRIEDRLFKIDSINASKRRFVMKFQGFDEPVNPVPDAPEIDNEETVKLI